MSSMFKAVIATSISFCLPCSVPAAERIHDLVIYGGTSAAVTAAIQAKTMGKDVIIVSPDRHLGGLSSGGLGFTDSGNKAVIGGLARQFYHRVWKHYETDAAWKWQKKSDYGNVGQGSRAIDQKQRTMWIFEPSVAEGIFNRWIDEHDIPVVREALLDRESGVDMRGPRIHSLRTLNGKTYRGKMFMDATYEGDLMAASGVSFHVGREASSVYNERWNGVQTGILHHGHWFRKPIDPYVIPGDPSSGLLYGISAEPPGDFQSGDNRVQAYCFRMCLTRVAENRIPFPEPDGYRPERYELLLRVFKSGWRETFRKFDPIPNLKTDTNNHGPFSTDNIGMNYDYPTASYQRRKEIIAEHENYQKGLMYFLANDPRVPEDVRTTMSQWGLARDEFTDNSNWPHQIYVREARRMIGDYVMTEHDCLVKKKTPRPIGMGSYTMDSHNVQRYVKPDGFVQNEGDIGVSGPPYQISYGSLVPRSAECENLLVPVALSSSHIAFGSIRMEPVFMILGQSASTAAVIAINQGCAIQDVEYAYLKKRLLEDGQVLEFTGSSNRTNRRIAPASLPGSVVDDSDAEIIGDWSSSTSTGRFVGASYLHDANTGKGRKEIRFKARIASAGEHEIRLAYSPNPNRATNVPITIRTPGRTTIVDVDQTKTPPIDGILLTIAQMNLAANESITVTVSTTGTDGYVIADAIQILPVKPNR